MRALITGVLGQDGSYLAEQLTADGHHVHGMVRPGRAQCRLNQLLNLPRFQLVAGDLASRASLANALRQAQPDVVYNLAAITSPGGAWGTPQHAGLADTTALGVVRLLDAMHAVTPDARLVHASSSAIYDPHRYGLYGIAKRFAHDTVAGYRAGHGMHASNAVLYSHTSPRQDRRFLAPTVAATLARIRAGNDERLTLTDLVGVRDWGYAPDHMRALPLIAAQDEPGDYDVATGQPHSVREFVDTALEAAGLTWNEAVITAPGPTAPPEWPADLAAIHALGWKPSVDFAEMVTEMVRAACDTVLP